MPKQEQRPTPEKFLRQLQEEERHQLRGKLKIYLGAAPGVGKTYTMLQDALAKRKDGLDVVIGIVETHGRRDIEDLISGLEVLPRQIISYRDQKLSEFDLDAVLHRNPGIILIDEMAHTNAPNLRHAYRWQDIKEILDQGIDVYTTLNVQHIESLNDVVSQIVGTRIRETVPDSMLELADSVELVDLPPDDLLKRLQEGKVYIPKQAAIATTHFFRKGNLIALRELALRAVAERVGAEVLLYRQGQGIERIWPTQEKLLVCVGANSDSLKVIRTAKRLASSLQADWIALHIDTPRQNLSDKQRDIVTQNMRFAEQNGAETKILSGVDIVKEIINFARQQNVTKIVIEKRIRPRWKNWLSTNLVDELVRYSGEIDIYIITGEATHAQPATIAATKTPLPWLAYGLALSITAIITAINFFLYGHVGLSNLIMLYLLGVLTIAMCGFRGPAIFASILSILALDFFFFPPTRFMVPHFQYFFTLVVMLLVTQVVIHLTLFSRRQVQAAYRAERRSIVLHTLSRQLASTRGVDKLLDTAVRYISDSFDSEVIALLHEKGHLVIKTAYKTEKKLSAKEMGVAQWVYDLGQIAGLGTDTLPFSDALYAPLLASQGPIGVLRIHPMQEGRLLLPEQMHLLEACANQIALAIEVDRLQEQARKLELEKETDHARSALLQSVSHDLRAPLVAIMGSASTLIEMSADLDKTSIKKLGGAIYTESEQLSRLINNLLQMTYLEEEFVSLQKEPLSIHELLLSVLKTESKQLGKKPVQLHFPEDIPPVPFDKTLMQEVLINLLDNAIKFTPGDSPIDISASIAKDFITISIEDRGPGLVPDEANKLFEKFYRGRMLTSERGIGLGLAICQRIIKAHGGEIWAENRDDGGAAFRFTLPLNS